MNFDRNTIIGFIVLAILFAGYFFYTSKEQAAFRKAQAKNDSIAQASKPLPDTLTVKTDSIRTDSFNKAVSAGGFSTAISGSEQIIVVDNEVARFGFTNRGGQPKWVELKRFKSADSTPVRLASTDFDKFSYTISTGPNKTAAVTDFYFTPEPVKNNSDGSKTIQFRLQSAEGTGIVHQYVIRPNNYMMDLNVQLNGVPQLIAGNVLNLTWQNRAVQLQKDLNYEKQQSQVNFKSGGDYDYENAMSSDNKEFDESVDWVAVKQQFFNSALVAKNKFTSGTLEWIAPSSGNTVVEATAHLKAQLPAGNTATVPLSLYYGPTDYKILKQYGNEMEDMVNLGTGIFAFVKYINRWIVLPAFDFFRKLSSNYGIVILLLTLFIRLLISPLTYSSYLSGAKMKVLKPEIEQLKAKYGSDQQQISMEQMKLFKEAGVNPLGGCIPGLLQIPIFFALYSFFNSNVALRGEPFLWADDLSVYDSVLNFGHIPVIASIYGTHVSLFTITAVITSFLISLYSMSMTPDQSNPVLKWMPYFFPIILLFIFNKLPAGLTWYYTVSNIITLVLQFIIQNYIINHDKILAKIEVNRKKPKTKSKWQERLEQMQEQQKKMQEMQNKGRKR